MSIPIYPTLNAASINQILIHSESKAIIVGKLDDYASQKEGVIDIPVISVGLYGNTDGELWEDIMFSQAPLKEIHIPKSEELITIIYTSGTTR